MTEEIVVAAFYRFLPLAARDMHAGLLECMKANFIRGTILLAGEGINGTVAGRREGVDALLGYIKENITQGELEHKESRCASLPFRRTRVKVKREIIRFDMALKADARTGERVTPADWNRLLAEPGVTVLDARNNYEVREGKFAGAIDPGVASFTQIKDYLRNHMPPEAHPRVATYCTGGIRCEKLSAWMLANGYREVYQLEGGILKYIEQMPREESCWQGDCFVFDERGAVDHQLAERAPS